MAHYAIGEDYITKYKTAIERGEPVVVEIRDETTLTHMFVKAILSRTEIEGGERLIPIYQMISVMDSSGATVDKPGERDLFVKIL